MGRYCDHWCPYPDTCSFKGACAFPRSKENQVLEKDIESAVCKYAQQTYDMLARKYTSPNHRSVPDRLFIGHGNLHFFIEFKRPGEVPTPNQEREIQRLVERGHRVYVIDDIDEGKRAVDKEVAINMVINEHIAQLGKTKIYAPRVPTEGC